MIEKTCLQPHCMAYPMFGSQVAADRIIWACSVHRPLLPPTMFHVKLETQNMPQLITRDVPQQGSLF